MTGTTCDQAQPHPGATRIELVLPEAPWGGPALGEPERSIDEAALTTLLAQVSSEPGPWLASVLGALVAPERHGGVLDRLDAVELAALVEGAGRLASWAQGLQARAAGALVEAQVGVLAADQAETVIKDRLRVTAREGGAVVRRGDRCARFPQVLSALEAGRIDERKADTLLGAGAELTDDERAAAIEVLLPEAPTRTWKWLSDQLNALANRLHGSGEELEEAAAGSNVWLETAAPGMALLTALMPAKDAARVFNAVQAGADQLMRRPGRRRGQARAAALTSLVTGRMVPHVIEEGVEGSLRVPVTDPGVLVVPVRDTDLVPVPAEDDGVLSTVPAPVEAGVVVRAVEVPATINVTVPAGVLAGPDDATPGILDLLGPIPAGVAREIAGEGVWHRLVTDPVTGVLTDYSTTTYQPPDRLRRAVQVRDRTCMSTGCDRPAARCDLDHVEPFDPDRGPVPGEPGQTRAGNLHALCRRHHNLKTHAGWHVERDPVTGAETWTSPTGHTEVYRPEPVDPVVRYARITGIEADPGPSAPPGLTLARRPRKPAIPEQPTASPPDAGEPPF
ncbi:HNH endonuclease signature motif containing protein [Myceligenerans salitolerans]|uniref:DUF222 domain-containing protein n=1 Tax=Myceligenerans salitolerans TaxID=1230528 RepID=A0ABS3I7V7_9MICO|nr:HNH endonuclease signature motif containing protein [Myceligenerans salitolerans]MBO0608563.1 DUF222 domain-containing protein [Myceligenerans salitolerans]